ncbi:arachidonate 12-lipoxygenase, 12R-type-like [Sphaeramia orbicularis]|uniref:Arachidonate 12-lipoxygenase, 12R-type-like n=1 Tax=Sphaeramia orbicularis TaxID=375764 RepID=A0A673AR94_9TELE|nr:arachidonate 12-lipoxygenase, 12R-type-like [Sphaeramia orbicularis]
MVQYIVTVYTGRRLLANTVNSAYIKLVGTEGESHRKLLNNEDFASFRVGWPSTFVVTSHKPLGKLVLIELEKRHLIFGDPWLVDKVEVQSTEGETYKFPIYSWLSDSFVHRFREGTALRDCDDDHLLGKYSRQQELREQNQTYQWNEDSIPHCMQAENPINPLSLPRDDQFSFTKGAEFLSTAAAGLAELKLTGLEDCKENWESIDDIKKVFPKRQTELSEYTQDHWEEDDFFGYQYLNGVNPMMIELCTVLPDNFPVTSCMVFPDGKTTLDKEMKNGNIFLVNYKNLDGIPANVINGKQQYLMAPLVLLHKTPENKLMPIAIQLKQCPATDNPIFLPTDDKYDWMLAKLFVRSADFSEHQLNYHLLRTHLLAEVFTMAMLRNLPMVHPLYKLLSPHTRYTLQINFLARIRLISPQGVFTQFSASGGKGMFLFLAKSLSSITYDSLCIKNDIAQRGMQKVTDFYYRDDGCELWDILERFVNDLLRHYYSTDAEVMQDSELQNWIQDIYEHGFFSRESTGIPQRFTTVAELVKFVTMAIFTSSCQHAAVNGGQYDYGGWMPNTPITLQLPPPTIKGKADKDTVLKTLPDVNATAQGMATVWLLSKQSSDFVPLGQYPEEHFTEEKPRQMIKKFQSELHALSVKINERNEKLEIPYTYLDPKKVENSVAI